MGSTEALSFYELKKQLAALREFRGHGTELISVYVTPKYPISEIVAKLRDEFGQASNIKSSTTRKNVQGALEKIMQYLKTFREPPENGLAVFCGNVSEVEGKSDIELYSVIPPAPIAVQFYRCESQFVLEPFEEMLKQTGTYGLVVMDGKEATVAVLKGKQTKVLKHLNSTAHQKVHKGGQCIHEKTLVCLANNACKEIRFVNEGDKIFSSDKTQRNITEGIVKDVYRKRVRKAILLSTERKKLILSAEHRVFVAGNHFRGLFAAELLKPGWKVFVSPAFGFDANNKLEREKIVRVEVVNAPADYFMDLSVSPNQAYFANGILVHNSAARYDRLHVEGVEFYYKRIGEAMDGFVGLKNFKGVIVGGPGPAKDDFLKMKPFNYQLEVLGVVDTGYTDEFGLRELLEKSGEIISEQEAVKEKKLFGEFMKRVTSDGLAAYGLDEIRRALEARQVERLLVSEGLELKRARFVCSKCGKSFERIVEQVVEEDCECGGKMRVAEENDVVNELIGLAEEQGVPVEMISRDTAEGSQFYGTFKGLGAFLRYK